MITKKVRQGKSDWIKGNEDWKVSRVVVLRQHVPPKVLPVDDVGKNRTEFSASWESVCAPVDIVDEVVVCLRGVGR